MPRTANRATAVSRSIGHQVQRQSHASSAVGPSSMPPCSTAGDAPPAWTEPLVLWQALVGRPSSGKSPALAPVRALLATLQEELGKGAAAGEKPFCLLADGAAEALSRALAAAPRGVMLWRDEPSGRLAFLDDSMAKDRSRWLEAWQGGPGARAGGPPRPRP